MKTIGALYLMSTLTAALPAAAQTPVAPVEGDVSNPDAPVASVGQAPSGPTQPPHKPNPAPTGPVPESTSTAQPAHAQPAPVAQASATYPGGQPAAVPQDTALAEVGNGEHTHDGFYLRFSLGVGYLLGHSGASESATHGAGTAFGFALGGAVTEDLIVYGELSGTRSFKTTISSDSDSTTFDNPTTLGGVGAGVAQYFGNNLFVSGTLRLDKLSIASSTGETIVESDTGYGIVARFGKEGWVSNQWGMGGVVEVSAAHVQEDLQAYSFAISMTATYN